MSKWLLGLLAVVGMGTAHADGLPVDGDIAGLKARIAFLENTKAVLAENECYIEVGKNKVRLGAGAVRENGLVIAISSEVKGNYLAYYTAPKPEHLRAVMMNTWKRRVGDIQIVSVGVYPSDISRFKLVVGVGSPNALKGTGLKPEGSWNPFGQKFWRKVFEKGDPPMVDYRTKYIAMPVPEEGEYVTASATTTGGVSFKVYCN